VGHPGGAVGEVADQPAEVAGFAAELGYGGPDIAESVATSSRSERIVGPLAWMKAADQAAGGGRLWLGSILPTSWEEHAGFTGDQPAGRGLAMLNEAGGHSPW
jgi:hypothetical protein